MAESQRRAARDDQEAKQAKVKADEDAARAARKEADVAKAAEQKEADQAKAEEAAAKEKEAADAKAADGRASARADVERRQAKEDKERQEHEEATAPEDVQRTAVFTVVMRDDNEMTRHDVGKLVTALDGEVVGESGRYLTVEVPTGTLRHPNQGHEKFVRGCEADPLVAEVQG